MHTRRVVVTGIGAVTPLGLDMESTWEALINGRSGVGPITRFDSSVLPVHVACEVRNFDPTPYIDPREVRRTDLFEQYALAAAHQAVKQAGLTITPELADEVGVVIGSSVGGFNTMLSQYDILREQGPRKINPFAIPMIMSNGAAGMVAIAFGARGPSYSPASACATSNDSIGQASELIRRGVAKVMICGGADATVSILGMAGFDRLGALSHNNALPSTSPRPFDKNRDGIVMGEGACVLVLEELEFAKARGAPILAEVLGYGQTTDAYHVVAPAEGGAGAVRAMRRALEQAGLRPEQVDYINAHGTATPLNDIAETQAVKTVFGDYAYKIPMSSTKSMTGHMMGATGALEAAVCIYAIQRGIIPPTINLTEPDPQCDLDYVPGEARVHRVNVAMNNSFGFGGHNSVLIFGRYDE
ncbi:MAG: beta-ketoacyl-ACP synthase II [Thermoflexales bacterium]|nr:beta-ketoacyl-ACP synthase II [Thermoflexales bacterium]MCS7324362.1 beta-ketoacyl-ACP synthase II [Thermoflexales bacterium]MCX7938970.1 beta-ketoacyl-ACP synthase II [Thermoflexales bacterium]MDW8054665.1 beta-ketoacyl-ACP synthase II [Anaerolineae bacterium]MDW8293319.1 beta-ketoacyl-ACP synthase II [Anaerolineae bacterium]